MLIAALLALTPAFQAAPPTPKLQAILALTIDPGFEDEWFHTRTEHGLKLESAGKVVCGQPFQVCAFAVGYAVGPRGRVDLRYDAKITRPDGKSYYEKQGLGLCSGEGIAAGNVQLAKDGLGVSFDPPDPRGEYTVTVQIHDQIAKTSSSAEAKISLVEFPAPRPFDGVSSLGDWFLEYHHSPDPIRSIDAIVTAGEVGAYESEEKNGPMRTFLREVLAANKFLAPGLLERFPKLERGPRLAALDVLAGSGWEAQEFLAGASEAEKEFFAQRVKSVRPSPLDGPIRDALQLDELWALFFAHGRYAPIERLARALSLDEQLAGKEKHAETIVLETAARWSMKSNLTIPRVRSYCDWMLANKRLDAQDATELKKLMEK